MRLPAENCPSKIQTLAISEACLTSASQELVKLVGPSQESSMQAFNKSFQDSSVLGAFLVASFMTASEGLYQEKGPGRMNCQDLQPDYVISVKVAGKGKGKGNAGPAQGQ